MLTLTPPSTSSSGRFLPERMSQYFENYAYFFVVIKSNETSLQFSTLTFFSLHIPSSFLFFGIQSKLKGSKVRVICEKQQRGPPEFSTSW